MTTERFFRFVNWLIRRLLLPSIVCGAILILVVSICIVPFVNIEAAGRWFGAELAVAFLVGAGNAWLHRAELRNDQGA